MNRKIEIRKISNQTYYFIIFEGTHHYFIRTKFPTIETFQTIESLLILIVRGSFSVVKEAVHIPTKTTVAMKTISKRYMSKRGWDNLCREIEIMLHLSHPNVLKMHEFIDTPTHVHLVLEL